MTEYTNTFIRPKRRKSHQTNTLLDKGLKEGYRNGTLVKPKTRRGKSVRGGR